MQHPKKASTPRKNSRVLQHEIDQRRYADYLGPQNSPYPIPLHGPFFPDLGPGPGPYYHEPPQHEPPPYLLPYAPYRQPPPGQVQYHNMPLPDPRAPGLPYQHHMPPLKRPRTEIRNVSSMSPSSSAQRSISNSTRTTHAKAPTVPRKTFSDFRISRVTIGSWSSDECKEDACSRDSKIRFCFRNPSDMEVPSTCSAPEAALMTPDRVSISVMKGTQRIIVPAHHIKQVEFRRNAGKISILTDGWAAFESSTLATADPRSPPETPTAGVKSQIQWFLTEEDPTDGELSRTKQIDVDLDMQKPLTEPKWTRGNIADHIDPSSRFLSIMSILDAEPVSSFERLADQWAGDSSDKAYFTEYRLTSALLLQILTDLMSSSNILTPAIMKLLNGMLRMIETSPISQAEISELLKSSLQLVPSHMFTKSLDNIYAQWQSDRSDEARQDSSPLLIESFYGGAKRQRGESEVPSDQLAKTTLDEKRRRLSDPDPEVPILKQRDTKSEIRKPTSRVDQPQAPHMVASKSEDTPAIVHVLKRDIKSRSKSESSNSLGDGARLSREELLRELEEIEGQRSSPDQEPPLEANSVVHATPNDEWPPLS